MNTTLANLEESVTGRQGGSMSRKTVTETTPAEHAATWAATLESPSQVIGWLQTQNQVDVDTACIHCTVRRDFEAVDLESLRRVAAKVREWGIVGGMIEKLGIVEPGAAAPVNGFSSAAAPPPPPASAATTPPHPLTEVEMLREQVKKLQQDQEERQLRQQKMAKCLTRIDKAEAALRHSEAALEKSKGDHKMCEAELAKALNELKLTAKGAPIQAELPLDLAPPPTDPTDWKQVRLNTLDMPVKLLAKLAEHEPPLTTLGELCAWQEKKGEFWAKVKGIGEAAAEKISKACEKYWAENPAPVAKTHEENADKAFAEQRELIESIRRPTRAGAGVSNGEEMTVNTLGGRGQ